MSGWLNLTQQGLAPCKRHQALLGARVRAKFAFLHKKEREILQVWVRPSLYIRLILVEMLNENKLSLSSYLT